MASRRLSFTFSQKLNQTYKYQPKAFYRRTVIPVNTYHRFRRKDMPQPQQFKYFLVLDFEATCDDTHFPEMEIIEFPCLKIDATTFSTLDKFHAYVRPVMHPNLTPFCTSLTGITQDVVDKEAPFPEVLDLFMKWIMESDINLEGSEPNAAFVTCGDWDLLTMLPNQCILSKIPTPSITKSWINIKKSFVHSTGVYPRGIKDMLSLLKLEHQGRLHSGIDDCKNIVSIMRGIAERNFIFQITRTQT